MLKILLLLLLSPAYGAVSERKATLDGSAVTVRLDDEGGSLEIVNSETPSNVLVRGRWKDEVFTGEAFCAAQPYPVQGVIDHRGNFVVMGSTPANCHASQTMLM